MNDSIWYNPRTNEIILQRKGWLLFEIEGMKNLLHFIPSRPWARIGEI